MSDGLTEQTFGDPKFKHGQRVAYVNDEQLRGIVAAVTGLGYRIKWDDGYKDDPGPDGYYKNHELVGLDE